MKFEKSNMPEFRGRQKTKWDDLLREFKNPGDVIHFTEGVTATQASQCAKRFNALDPENKYHSGKDALKGGLPFVRRRMPGELDNEKDDEEEQEEQPKQSLLDKLSEEDNNHLY